MMTSPEAATADGAGRAALPRYTDHVTSASTDEPARRPWWPSLLLIVVGLILAVAPLAADMFYPAAQGQQMIGEFDPYVQPERLDEFRGDLGLLERARVESQRVTGELRTPAGEYPLIETFGRQYPAINADLTAMLDQIDSGRPDFDQLKALQPLSLIPFVPLLAGSALVLIGGWGIVRARRGASAWPVVALGAAVAVALIAVPLVGGQVTNTRAAGPLLDRFSTVLTEQQVRAVQSDFVVLVGAVGEMDSGGFADAAHERGIATPAIDELGEQWQPMSSDFAGLIGTMNDNLQNYSGVAELDDKTRALGFGAFAALPWVLIGAGFVTLAALAAQGVRPARRPAPTTDQEVGR